jgi:hypothetical protein
LLLLISSSFVQLINGNAAVLLPALGLALLDAVVTSSLFPSFWTKSSRAIAQLLLEILFKTPQEPRRMEHHGRRSASIVFNFGHRRHDKILLRW